MDKRIIKNGILDNKYYRIVTDVNDILSEDSPTIIREFHVKLQIKIFTLGFSRYITIKEWYCDYYNTAEKDFIKNEAIELFDKIVKPYDL